MYGGTVLPVIYKLVRKAFTGLALWIVRNAHLISDSGMGMRHVVRVIAALAFFVVGQAHATLVTIGFDGRAGCDMFCPQDAETLNALGGTGPVGGINAFTFVGTFTIDTDASDPANGPGTGASLNIGTVNFAVANFSIGLQNDQLGAYCGFGPGHQLRDRLGIHFSSNGGPSFFVANLEAVTCNTGMLVSDSVADLVNADFSMLANRGDVGISEPFISWCGDTGCIQLNARIFGVHLVPEPSSLALVVVGAALLGTGCAKQRRERATA